MKKELIIFIFLMSLVGIVSAQTCNITSSCAPANTVMKLYSTTDSHGELWNGTAYNNYLCCDFTGTHECSGNNKILRLQNITNAHAEIPSNNNFNNIVCFGSLSGASGSGSCPAGYNIPLVSLSGTTDAHIGKFGDYPTKICGNDTSFCGDGIKDDDEFCDDGANNGQPGRCKIDCTGMNYLAYWVNGGGSYISTKVVIPGETILYMFYDGSLSGAGEGAEVSFEIYEEDGVLEGLFDDDIRVGANAITGILGADNTTIVEVILNSADIEAATEPLEFGGYEFYFKVDGNKSNILDVTVTNPAECVGVFMCGDYSQEDCEQDACQVAVNNVEENSLSGGVPTVECDDENVYCSCAWYNNQCVPSFELYSGGSGLGTCIFNENVTDDCADGYLTYLWGVSISWPPENEGLGSDPGGGDYIFFDSAIDPAFDNFWHYNPVSQSTGKRPTYSGCRSSSKTVSCPSQVELGFFGIFNFIFASILITLIYLRREKR